MLQVRRATETDKRDLLSWRNDPATVAASVSSVPVPWSEHAAWFEGILADRERALYVGEFDDNSDKVGMCRFDLDEWGTSAEVSINLNPVHRGKKLSAALLMASIQAFRAEFGALSLTATIRADNVASIRLFSSAGFTPKASEGEFRRYQLLPSAE
jgi:RimJ/RimL family protein N-acetyltransferase